MARLCIVDNDHVHALDRLHQGVARDIDPEVHCIERHQFRVRHLFAHSALEIRLDVAKKDQPRILRGLGKFWLKVGKNIQLGIECMGHVKIVVVASKPPERLAVGDSLEVGGVDTVGVKDFLLSGAKISTNNAYDPNFSHLPKGVSTASNATEPTTRRDIGKIRVSGFGFRVSGFGFRVSGFGFRVSDLRS